ncbi:Uncharacterised protein [Mycobacteroides abscessus subsp. abscessus]|nr:Uncharacterised protein [Mycobacteroides abscessus subsp. abscessus]SKV43763.1 Uncharacterised protein [Mycobacteroides abscessus subsp. abscessus]
MPRLTKPSTSPLFVATRRGADAMGANLAGPIGQR